MHALVAALDWHLLKERIFDPNHAFAQALIRTVLIAVLAQILGVLLGLRRRSSRCRAGACCASSPTSTSSSFAARR